MGYGLESGGSESIENTGEVSESVSFEEGTAEVAEDPEDFDDCGTPEVQEVNGGATETAEDFDDCELDENEKVTVETIEMEEQNEFDDCALENESGTEGWGSAEGKDAVEIEEEDSGIGPEVREEGIEVESEMKEEAPETEGVETEPEVTDEEIENETKILEADTQEKLDELESGKEDSEITEGALEEKEENISEKIEECEEELKEASEVSEEDIDGKLEEAETEIDDDLGEAEKEIESTKETRDVLEEKIEKKEEQNAEIEEESKELEKMDASIQSEEIEEKALAMEEELEVSEVLQNESEVTKEMEEVREDAEEKFENVRDISDRRNVSELKRACVERDEHSQLLEQYKEEVQNLTKENAARFDAVMKETHGTDSFKEALREYNISHDREGELKSEISDMEKAQTELEQKATDLRNAQLEKGEEAVAASDVSIAAAQELQEKFDDAYYDKEPNVKELSAIQEENRVAIAEMSSERHSVQLAMEAKMAEIRDYVNEHHLERYETERDPHYREMLEEYRAFDAKYRELDYNVAKLDENSIQIAEITGEKYESIRYQEGSLIREVNEGVDVPGETNYFVDETRANEVLSPFKRDTWENMTIQEQKAAVEELALYNADILGIANPPDIRYYRKDDPTDFGGFSASNHTIYINENNMGNAAETADTISHEYRHCYQHERAEKLETERDLEFKEGFDSYIAPENDYFTYKNQLVEKDAREYAEVVKNKIASMESSDEETAKKSDTAFEHTESFKTMNPEKGAVFDEKTVDILPEDFKKKNVGIRDPKEVFEVEELQKGG